VCVPGFLLLGDNVSNPNPQNLVGSNGIIDDQTSIPMDSQPFTQPAQAEPDMRDVIIRVPSHMDDHLVLNAVQLGMSILAKISEGSFVAVFPAVARNKEGQAVPVIGKQEMIIAKGEDIIRVRTLMRTIHDINLAIRNAPDAVSAATLALEGTQKKDDAAREATSAAQGVSPIAIARG
jgi:hypothetical protein